ncbi:unnamed protein product [Adineta steineri]|uniref:Uncharacterized protein n=1 Tax=Adineta steineri TaxID=433720 RepID=A0A818HR52_9BILA|nr:unnamed protein product [Adineta steineri]CAF1351457.1 unnamed protein product [Adineta steineri]CAF3513043.1 unnamed protein product [Adineta steineri]CAF3672697.1 unnamed protein product [Adineta steineri]
MIRFTVFSIIFLISFTISLPTCNIFFWVNLSNFTCTGSPNGTYSAVTYNGQCMPSPDDPIRTSYRLIIDAERKTVHNFTYYIDGACDIVDELVTTKVPLSLDTCGPILIKSTPTSFVQIGGLMFSCKD